MQIIYYKLTPSDMRIEGHTHFDSFLERDMKRCPACNPEIPATLDEAVRTERPTVPVHIVNVEEEDPFHGLTVCVYYREA